MQHTLEHASSSAHWTETHQEMFPLSLYPHIFIIRELLGYTHDNGASVPTPIWGKRLGLYHPVTSELVALDKLDWNIFDLIAQEHLTVSRLSELTGADPDAVQGSLSAIAQHWLALEENSDIEFTPVLPKPDEVEIYMETTEMCNFGCLGCAAGMDRIPGSEAKTLDTKTAKNLLEKIFLDVESKGARKLRLKWAGGEAMIPAARKIFAECQLYIQDLKTQHPQLEIEQIVLTNGSFLTDDIVSLLASSGAHVSVSLWGVGEENDIARRVRRKKDTFENIRQGLGRLHNAEVSFNINHVITPDNADKFPDMVRALWDPESEQFIGRDWNWQGEKKPISMGIAFFRPQTPEQLEVLQSFGYARMVNGIRKGFDVVRELTQRKIKVQSLGSMDYLQLFGDIPTSCGSGFNYIAVGPKGVASCHEALYAMDNNMNIALSDNANMLDLANAEYAGQECELLGLSKQYPGMDKKLQLTLALHGGAGCPRTMKMEQQGKMENAASTAHALYAPLIEEILALETMRRLFR